MSTPTRDQDSLELDIAIARRVYGYCWHDMGVQPGGHRLYIFGSTTTTSGMPMAELPVLHASDGVLRNTAWEHVVTAFNDLPRPSLNQHHTWDLARFVACDKKVHLGLSLHSPKEAGSDFSQTIASWHRDEDGKPDVSERTCLVMRTEAGMEKAVTKSVLDLYDRL